MQFMVFVFDKGWVRLYDHYQPFANRTVRLEFVKNPTDATQFTEADWTEWQLNIAKLDELQPEHYVKMTPATLEQTKQQPGIAAMASLGKTSDDVLQSALDEVEYRLLQHGNADTPVLCKAMLALSAAFNQAK